MNLLKASMECKDKILTLQTQLLAEKDKAEESLKAIQTTNPNKEAEKAIEDGILLNEKNYKNEMYQTFNRYLHSCVEYLKALLDEYLQSNGYDLQVSVTVKLLKRTLMNSDDEAKVEVISGYRDNRTHLDNLRKIGDKLYSINKNTAFHTCMTENFFLKNNFSRKDHDYQNENINFEEFYNCAVVAPIKMDYSDETYYFGFLACDVLNKKLDVEPLDLGVANIMVATALQMGMIFDELVYQMDYVVKLDFLQMVYEEKQQRGNSYGSSYC